MLNTNIFPVFIMMLLGLNSLIAQQNGEIKITNIEHVNTPAREFSPTYYQQGLVYVSSESRRGKMDTKTNESTFDLMYADMGPKGKLSKPGPLSLKVNTPYYEGPVAFSPDMQKMYFTGTNLLNGKVIRDKQGVARLKIYEATRGKDDWEKIKQLPFNDDQFSCIHPTLSKDGQNLYFASDRPGGSGGMDLYVVKWMNGTWSNPMNLGTEVNSPENDVFPYIHPSGKLLFASRRSSSMGGLDIYMADVTSKKPGKVEQLPAPINSTSDDFGILLSNAGSLAFFSSERAGGKGKDDIYRADIPGGLKGLFPPTEFEALVKVLNKETGEALEAAKVTVREIKEGQSVYENNDVFETELIENQDKELLIRYSIRNELFENETKASTDKSGTARVSVTETKKYLVVASKKGFRSNHTTYVAFQTNGTTPVIEIRLWPAVKPVEVPVATLEVGSIIVLDQLYYDFDKSYIRTDASKGLDAILALMKEYPAMKIDLTSFTDSRGTTDYNLDLSARRSGSAKYYLTSRGIEESRIKAYGKGESNPRNRCVDGVKCSEEEYQYNRRTEVKITSLGTDTKRIEYIDNAPEYIDRAKLKKKN